MELREIVPWGRSFDEYRRMFALSESDLGGTILGCGDGPAGFNAEATARGDSVVSCDPIYAFSAGQIERRVHETYEEILSQVRRDPGRFVWTDFRDPDELGRRRMAAVRRFLADYAAGRKELRYVAAALPHLPFADGRFALAVVSHLLFLYSDRLDLRFHLAAFDELLRVAGEVRVFPLLTLGGEWSPHVGPVCRYLEQAGHRSEVLAMSYEFQRADDHTGNRMLRVTRQGVSR